MAQAVKCPVCVGRGTLVRLNDLQTCHGCSGKGWIEIGDEWQPIKVNVVKKPKPIGPIGMWP